MRSLILINCSKRKSMDPLNLPEVLRGEVSVPSDDLEREADYRRALSKYSIKAMDLYDGPEFKAYRELASSSGARLLVMSARYGIIDGNRSIIPYDATLAGKSLTYIEEMVSKWLEHGNYDVAQLSMDWDCAVIRLSDNYLLALELMAMRLGIDVCSIGGTTIVIGGSRIGELNGCVKIFVRGNGDARSKKLIEKINHCLSSGSYRV
ncbi:DUF6884 domain-containing protein [Thermocladium modestius]|nr:DUF6884 domain-containing protein [Thermocladium modestius]